MSNQVIKTSDYIVKNKDKIQLADYPTKSDITLDKDIIKEQLFPIIKEELKDLQEKYYAEKEYGFTLVFQAMDAAGKDSTINNVFSGLNLSGVKIAYFKKPSVDELNHDYLWRVHTQLPSRGEIGVFNRSHYEDVIVSRVHKLETVDSMPKELITNHIWEERYEQINHFEKYLAQNGFPMVKIFLDVSKKEQQKRIIDRIVKEKKNWKFDLSDLAEREYWDEYQKVYEDILNHTSTSYAPWYIVPADDKWVARLIVAHILKENMKKLNPSFPLLSPSVQEQLDKYKELANQGKLEGIIK